MVWTRGQLENHSKEELIEEHFTVDNISTKLSELSKWFDDIWRFEDLSSDLTITKTCNRLVRVVQLERDAAANV